MIGFVKALTRDARTITRLRRVVWDETYRGIYPDEAIDNYCEAFHEARDLARILDPDHEVFVIRNDGTPVGYFSFIHKDKVHITSLYVIRSCKGLGAGSRAIDTVREYCKAHFLPSFTVNCNEHNLPARAFYEHMGGKLVLVDGGHEEKREDQATYSFEIS